VGRQPVGFTPGILQAGRAMTRIEFETTNSGTGTKVTVRIEDADRELGIACFLNLVIDRLQMCSPRVAVKRLVAGGHLTPAEARGIKADIAGLRAAIVEILTADRPQTVRQIFYRLVVRGLVQKAEIEYSQTVSRLLTEMRLAGELEWSWIVDNSRRTSVTRTFDNVADALDDSARYYRRSALRESDVYIEIWTEKDALVGILYGAASIYDVPVVSSRGIPSISQLRISFDNIQDAADAGKEVFIYQFGDHDPTGCLIPRHIERQIGDWCDEEGCDLPAIERVALTEEQIERYRLPTRPTKRQGNPHACGFKGESVELDALPSTVLRDLVRECIAQHIGQHELNILREAERSERDFLKMLAREHGERL
jgi:hypothetical protein